MLYYIASLKGKPRTPPSLDEVVIHQYLAKKSGMCLSTSYNKLMRKFAIALESETSTHIDSLCNSGYLYMAPLHNVPNDLINFISASSGVFKYIYGGTFDTVDEARRQLWKDNKEKPTWALIVINDLVNGFDIDIQLNAKSLPALNQVVTLNYRGGYSPEGSEMYMMSGYITIQKLLYDYFIYKQHARGLIPSDFSPSEIIPIMVSFPDIKNEQHFLVEFAGTLMSLAIILAFIYPFTQMTKRLVLDKELQTQQTMLVMGTMRHSMWISYFILSFLEYFLISILMTFVLCLHALTLTNPLIIFMTLLVYSCTLIPLAGLISTLFSNCRVASLFAPMLYFILAVVNFLIHGLSETGLLALSFLSPTGMSNLLPSILKRESGSGFTMNDFTNPFFDAFPYKVILIIAMDFPIYLLFMLYLDAVLPYERSMPKHPLFFILPVVKRLKRRFGYCTDEKEESGDDDHDDDPRGTTLMDPSVGIDAMTGRPKKPIIRLRKVRKSYSRGKSRTVAVDSLSWVLYQGEVSVLLGPNGSGKSTTVGIITGMTKPDKGDCIVNGHSVTKETSGVRASIGLCPQLNTLWPDLTCREHLELFAKIKGLKGAAVENAIWDVLCAVDLSDKIDFHISMLSGGQKRKLCVAIAFVGQNRVIVLDEPTAGMDATARRHIWSLLRAMSAKRTILLITHYMDETDLLGDHVGILSNGKLTCAGSNLFLRSYSGFGYTLRLNLLPFDRPPIHKNDSLVTSAEREVNCLKETWSRLTNMIKNIMCDVYCTSQTDREITFRIPNGHENDIPKLLRYLERIEKKEIGLRSYALVAPSMEDVFMNMLEARSDNGHPSNVRTHLHQKDNEVVKGKPHAKPAKVQQGMSATPSVTSEKNPLSLNQDWCKGNVPIQEENVPRASKKGQSGTVPPTTLSSSGSEVSVQISKKTGSTSPVRWQVFGTFPKPPPPLRSYIFSLKRCSIDVLYALYAITTW
ncbi:unnamed protein product [Phytomonas sp. Hart1]|nr:unnamed protein product [Phytomonas sp. Hart1]|eukprot:CCW67770.1 unnamed protein product [Phytomonas sp. isolate Hart1]